MKKYAVSLFLIFLILFEYKMGRDKIKNKEYFESIITQKKENISFYLNALKNNRVAIDRPQVLSSLILIMK